MPETLPKMLLGNSRKPCRKCSQTLPKMLGKCSLFCNPQQSAHAVKTRESENTGILRLPCLGSFSSLNFDTQRPSAPFPPKCCITSPKCWVHGLYRKCSKKCRHITRGPTSDPCIPVGDTLDPTRDMIPDPGRIHAHVHVSTISAEPRLAINYQ